ncbi:MAG: 2-C-methyl-D-erythritol 4-phosphate cytidylyltransferase [Candidatus Brocadiaceae bacterium]|jgi:2-C-methyl-D-erythritol 4-phosphate cytidylyltransferase
MADQPQPAGTEALFAAVVPAAGTGTRMGGCKKPYLPLAGRPVLDHTVQRLLAAEGCRQIVVVVHEQEFARGDVADHLEAEFGVRDVVPGGPSRQESVRCGLGRVRAELDLVLIHDAVRPLVSPDVVRRVAVAAKEHGAAIAAVPAVETVKEVADDERIVGTPPRRTLWYARTPQGFRRDLIVRAHHEVGEAGFNGTDDAELVERLGEPVYVVEDCYDNVKITTEEDLVVAEAILRRQEGSK